MAETRRRRGRSPWAVIVAGVACSALVGCPVGEDSSGSGTATPVAADESLRSALVAIDPEFADAEEVEFVHLYAVTGDPRVFVAVRFGSVVRTALYEVRIDSGVMRRLAPDPEVFPSVDAGAWRRWPAPAVVRADGRIVLFEDDGIRVVPDSGALVRSGVPERLPNEAVRAVHGEIDDIGHHLGNVAERDRRSPDGRRMIAALTRERSAPSVPLGVLDLETGDYLTTEFQLDMIDGARVDACVWRDPRTFVLCLWRYDLGRRTWHVCTVREDRIDTEPMAAPPGERRGELVGMVGEQPVIDRRGAPAEDTVPRVTIGTWGLEHEHGAAGYLAIRGAAGDRALFQGGVPRDDDHSSLVVVEEATGGAGFTADWIDLATIEGGELIGSSEPLSVHDAVPDPGNGAAGSAWLLLHARHGLLRLTPTDAGAWRVTVVPVRPEGSEPGPGQRQPQGQDPPQDGAAGGPDAGGQ